MAMGFGDEVLRRVLGRGFVGTGFGAVRERRVERESDGLGLEGEMGIGETLRICNCKPI